MSADPRFVDGARGVFWLKADSPARGRGSREHAPTSDFWGRPAMNRDAPELGAFAYVAILASDEARAGWRHGWPYRFVPQEKLDMPDLWTIPASE